MSQEQDKDTRIALLIVFALIAAVVAGVLWFGVSTALKRDGANAAALVSTQDSPEPVHVPGRVLVPFVAVDGAVAAFHFEPGAARLLTDAQVQSQLGDLLERLRNGAIGMIVPFGGSQPETGVDAGLAEQRAHAVRDALVRLGVPAARLTIAPLQTDAGATDLQRAQRVELIVADGTLAQEQAEAAAPAGEDAGPRVQVVDGIVTFYFAVGSAELAPGAAEALKDVVDAVAAGRRAVLSGFTDPTGDAALNEELAKQRAFAVRDALVSLGVPQERVELERPVSYTGTGSLAEARRVEVRLED